MSTPHLLASSIIAIACTLPAAAQSFTVPTKPASDFQLPTVSTGSVPFFLQAQPPASAPLFIVPKPQIQVFSATVASPCYTLRTYGMTPHDLESKAPKPSSYSTCTPAAAHAFKPVAVPPTK